MDTQDRAHTLVDQLQLGDDVQSNLGKLVLEHLEEHGEEVVDGPASRLVIATTKKGDFEA